MVGVRGVHGVWLCALAVACDRGPAAAGAPIDAGDLDASVKCGAADAAVPATTVSAACDFIVAKGSQPGLERTVCEASLETQSGRILLRRDADRRGVQVRAARRRHPPAGRARSAAPSSSSILER